MFKENTEQNNSIDKLPKVEDEVSELKSLSPNNKLNGPQYKRYKSYLDNALDASKKDTNKNIAITGKYGSGKSSIVETYFRDRNDYLKVGFSTFKGKSNKNNGKDEMSKSNIFANIINQIIYQIDPDSIPLTKFKIKKPLGNFFKIAMILEVFLIISFVFNSRLKNYFLGISRIILIFFIGGLLFWQILSRTEFSRVKISSKRFETYIDMTEDDLFEKYTDEIIYLFEQTNKKSKKRILIIEDLDRFEDVTVFEKLRELNTKLNYKDEAVDWQFIYMIRDDLFEEESERVKFFDLIIPVIPYINSINSFDKLHELFPDNDMKLKNILSLFIDDYRLLQNISNEYKIYRDMFNEQDENELLALIAYKNLFPDEFDDLQNKGGDIQKIIYAFNSNKKKKIIEHENEIKKLEAEKNNINLSEQEIEKLRNDISGLTAELSSIKSSKLSSVKREMISENHNEKINELLITLIINGFIKEDYLLVINHYYGDPTNLEFLRNLYLAEHAYDTFLSLTRIDELVPRLSIEDYDKVQILNYDLAIWLFKNNKSTEFSRLIETAQKRKEGFIETLINLETSTFNFIDNIIPNLELDLRLIHSEHQELLEKIVFKNKYEATEDNFLEIELWINDGLFSYDSANILNNPIIYTEFKKHLMSREHVKGFKKVDVKDIEDIELWSNLLNNNRVIESQDNVIAYFEYAAGKEIDEHLIDFINAANIEYSSIENEDFYDKLLFSNGIDIDKLSEIFKFYEYGKWFTGSIIGLDDEKIQMLINLELIEKDKKYVADLVGNYHRNLRMPNKQITHGFKEIIVETNPEISQKIFFEEILQVDDDLNDQIFIDNLNYFDAIFIREYLKNKFVGVDSNKLIKIMDKINGYQNIKLVSSADNKKILNWMKELNLIKEYQEIGKMLKPIFK